ncbi:PadR family transcriptional regulator [uncultured Schumannella sp.]|uniref:PadR family transcriptional regulator n=1 Tax=uncultured Schumannella sp. TaxID=1195956 RepID=UPI0025FD7346|nr:PadR family transcriptional regulator [uncultured Schumannella sp.]
MNHSSHPGWESRGRRPGFDSGFSGGPGFGPESFDFPFGPRGRRGGPGGRARRGDVRAAILGLLAEEAGSGYSLIKRIQERSEGAWRPSPGSIYPTLQQLVDEELIASTGGGGRASEFALTDEGRAYVDEHADEIAAAWNVGADRADARAELREYRDAAGRLMRALWQFPHEATAEQRTRAIAEMEALRKSLYGILAE